MKIQIMFHSQKLRVTFLVALCALIGLLASLSLTVVHAATPALPPELKTDAAGKMVLLDFYSEFCGTCRMMEPYLKRLEAKTGNEVHFRRIDLTTPNNEQYQTLYGIESTPIYILYNAKGEAVYRMEDRFNPIILEKQILRLSGKLKTTDFPIGLAPDSAPQPETSVLNKLILVSFENEKCKACQEMNPYLQGFEMTGQPGLQIVHLDTETPAGKKLMDSLDIKALPTYVLFDNGGEPNTAKGELFRTTGKIEPRTLWDIIRLFGEAGV